VWIRYAPQQRALLPSPRSGEVVLGPPPILSIDDTVTQPLLAIDEQHHDDQSKEPVSICTEPEWSQESAPEDRTISTKLYYHWHLQWSSLLLGSLIGWLIQCATLSANVCMLHFQQSQLMHSPQENWTDSVMVGLDPILRQGVLHALMACSLLLSGMGIGLLFLVRSLLMQLPLVVQDMNSQDDVSTVSKCTKGGSLVSLVDHRHIILRVECYLAVGAVCGLNLAWSITGYVLGMEKSHWYQSLWIVLGTMVWCQFVLYCSASHQPLPQRHSGCQVSRVRSRSVESSMVV
jgi:hypothetical protein